MILFTRKNIVQRFAIVYFSVYIYIIIIYVYKYIVYNIIIYMIPKYQVYNNIIVYHIYYIKQSVLVFFSYIGNVHLFFNRVHYFFKFLFFFFGTIMFSTLNDYMTIYRVYQYIYFTEYIKYSVIPSLTTKFRYIQLCITNKTNKMSTYNLISIITLHDFV